MADQELMKQGLAGLFKPQDAFEKESSYGKTLIRIAWVVEICAVGIGLFIAVAMAQDGLNKLGVTATNSDSLNALIGALPFFAIAAVELTKIPLAFAFYNIKIIGWKIFILIAMLALTVVTFETMFNGLERNTSNINRQVDVLTNQIFEHTAVIEEKERVLTGFSEQTTVKNSEEIVKQIAKVNKNFQTKRDDIVNSHNTRTAEIIIKREALILELKNPVSQNVGGFQAQKDTLIEKRKTIQDKLDGIILKQKGEIKDYKDGIAQKNIFATNKTKETTESYNNEITSLKNQIATKEDLKSKTRDRFQKQKDRALESLEKQKTSINSSGSWGKNAKIKREQDSYNLNITKLSEDEKAEIATINAELIPLNRSVLDVNNKKNKLLDSQENYTVDDQEIDKIKKRFTEPLTDKEMQIGEINKEIDALNQKANGAHDEKIQADNKKIENIDNTLQDMRARRDSKLKEAEAEKSKQLVPLEKQQQNYNERAKELQAEKIPKLQEEIGKLKEMLNETKKEKREAVTHNQVFRMAALLYGHDDVINVTKDQIKIVSLIWFGSIAVIVSTMGTILALASFVLRDPEAFVARKKFSLSRRINRLFYLFFWRTNRILFSIMNVLLAITRLILSFAEIFRGSIGRPAQRSLRRYLLARRKKVNKPRIITVEKEIEKVVEKIIIKEVPVDKVVIKEVPVEIIRKELVYVPLYSTESGLIDTSATLAGSVPKDLSEAKNDKNKKDGSEKGISAKSDTKSAGDDK